MFQYKIHTFGAVLRPVYRDPDGSSYTLFRGLPGNIYSENGKNLVGASHELTDCYNLLDSTGFQQAASHLFTVKRINWNFSPAPLKCAKPHFGGLWEAGVKAMKTILRKILPSHLLTFEEFNTILTSVEATPQQLASESVAYATYHHHISRSRWSC